MERELDHMPRFFETAVAYKQKIGFNGTLLMRREITDIEDLFIAHISGMDTVAPGLKNAAKILEICTSWRFWRSSKVYRLKGRKKRMEKEKVMMKLMNLRDTIFPKKQHSHFLTHPLCTSSTAAKHLTPHKHII